MGQPRTKAAREAGELSQTAKSHCDLWLREQIYHRKYEFKSKQTDKGNLVEASSIDFIADQLGLGILSKNEERFENDYMTGTPDILLPDMVIDAKNSWDWTTLPVFDVEIPNKDYPWQGQGYMILTKRDRFLDIYVLSDTPNKLIRKEAYFFARDMGLKDADDKIYDTFAAKMTYPDVTNALKFRVFEVDKDPKAHELIKAQVKKCRAYIDNQIRFVLAEWLAINTSKRLVGIKDIRNKYLENNSKDELISIIGKDFDDGEQYLREINVI